MRILDHSQPPTPCPPESLPLLGQMLMLAAEQSEFPRFLHAALSRLLEYVGAGAAVLAAAEEGSWTNLAMAGKATDLPAVVVAEAADRSALVQRGDWTALPIEAPPHASAILAAHNVADSQRLSDAAGAFALAVSDAWRRTQTRRRLARLETILTITQQWNRTHEMEPLLNEMAEAATRLLDADRASIFLWDRPHKTLVGRPALGAPRGELRIGEDMGVVGQVLQSGEPRRVASADPAQVDHTVDEQLGYRTRNLVCVPLTTDEGLRLGAFEALNKNKGEFTAEDEQALIELASHAVVALANTQQFESLLATQDRLIDQAAAEAQLVGGSPAIEALRSTIARVADTDLAVLVMGENGTGKEVACRLLHYMSRRRSEPYVAVNCAALTETLLESELFGHERGAFTDAHESRPGKFEIAGGGTLFLDEIGDLSIGGQAKLLRVLEEKVVVRVGGATPIETDVRVLAATNQDLAAMVRERRFREDLFFRLNVVALELPPLRERGEDIVLLAEHFLRRFCMQAGRRMPKLSDAAKKRLMIHRWPGNIRELRNLMERLAYLLPDDHSGDIAAADLAFVLSPQPAQAGVDGDLPLAEATRRFQVDLIEQTMAATQGNVSEAAERLGLHRSNLYRKMSQLGMSRSEEE